MARTCYSSKRKIPFIQIGVSDKDWKIRQSLYEAHMAAFWSGRTHSSARFWKRKGEGEMFPKELVEGTHDSLMQVRYKNGSLFQIVGVEDPDILVGTNPRGIVFSEYSLQNPSAQTSLPVVCGGRLSGLGDY